MITPAIVLSTHTMGMGVIHSLGIMGVPIVAVYYDIGDMGYHSKYVQEKIQSPHPENCEERFIDLLLDTAKRFPGGLLVPTSDDVLTTVSKHKKRLEEYYIVACTEWEITRRYIEKINTHKIAEAAGVPAPKTKLIRTEAELEELSSQIQYPCLVKPSRSHQYYHLFKTKMVHVHNYAEMLASYQEAANAGLEVMIQEYIPGEDSNVVNYNSYFWDGYPHVEFTAQQIRKAPPEFGAPRVVISKEIPEVIEPGRKILQAMNFSGYSCAEFKKDPRDNTFKLMEVNGRHNRSILLSLHCGINFPWLQYRHLIYGELPSPSPFRSGTYWISLERDIGYSLKYLLKEHYSPLEYLRPYLKRHVYDVLNWQDLKPFIGRGIYLLKRLLRKIIPINKKDLNSLEAGG